jgi:hypothetical protein
MEVLDLVDRELYRAEELSAPMPTAHDGWAVILEEVDELWDEVKLKPSKRSVEKMREEAVQVAAMAVRFILDICPPVEENERVDSVEPRVVTRTGGH